MLAQQVWVLQQLCPHGAKVTCRYLFFSAADKLEGSMSSSSVVSASKWRSFASWSAACLKISMPTG